MPEVIHEIPTALLVSGGGSTALSVVEAWKNREIPEVAPVCVISSRADKPGPELRKLLEETRIPLHIINPRDFPGEAAFSEALRQVLRELDVQLVSMNGFLRKLPPDILAQYTTVNQHPGSLDPGGTIDFGGKGMYGSRVVCAQAGYMMMAQPDAAFVESTVHYAVEDYDKGPLITVEQVAFSSSYDGPVTIARLQADSDSLRERTVALQSELLPVEHRNVQNGLRLVARGMSTGEDFFYFRHNPLIPYGNEQMVRDARKLAIELFPNG